MIPTPPAVTCHAQAEFKLDESQLLSCIKMVRGDAANHYGLSEAVRIQHKLRVNIGTDYDYAVTHLRWLEEQLSRHGHAVTVYNLVLCWNLGLTGGIRIITGRHWSDAGMDYAQRVQQLYELPDKQV